MGLNEILAVREKPFSDDSISKKEGRKEVIHPTNNHLNQMIR